MANPNPSGSINQARMAYLHTENAPHAYHSIQEAPCPIPGESQEEYVSRMMQSNPLRLMMTNADSAASARRFYQREFSIRLRECYSDPMNTSGGRHHKRKSQRKHKSHRKHKSQRKHKSRHTRKSHHKHK